ncbi:MAG: LPS assembly lipoprotein LptE [Alphaproteobacteria bacterium]
MSSGEISRRSVLRSLALIGAGVGLTGCLTPVYGDRGVLAGSSGGPGAGTPNATTQAKLANVDFTPVGGRLGVIFTNEMIYLLSGGAGRPANPTHVVSVGISGDSVWQLLNTGSGAVVAQSLTLIGNFTVTDKEKKTIVHRGSAFATSSIARGTQRLAAERAILDAQERAAKNLAELVVLQVATWLAQQNQA